MSLVSIEDALLAYLWEKEEGPCPLSDAVDSVVSGEGLLSRQVAVSSTIERLSEEGIVTRKRNGAGVLLSLTDAGQERAAETYSRLAGREIDLVEGADRLQCTAESAAERLGQSVASVLVGCSEDGEFYADEGAFEGQIVDREHPRSVWSDALDRCITSASGEVVLLRGTSGIGKTTLVEVLTADARERSEVVRAVQTGCVAASGDSYRPVRTLVDSIDESTDPFADAADRPVDFDATDDSDMVRGHQHALFESIADVLEPDDGVRSIAIDDLHRADAATVAFLRYLLDELPDRRLVVLLTTLPGELVDSPLQPDTIEESPATTTLLDLEGFDADDTKRLVERIVGRRGAPGAFVEALQARTDGKPFHVETTVETLLEDDQLDPSYRWYPDGPDAIELPDAARETITRPLDVLDETARELLRWTAVAGEAVPVDVLASVMGDAPASVEPAVDLLVRTKLLYRSDGAVAVQTELTRTALLETFDDDDRRRRHERLAAALAERDDAEGYAATIARQYEHADRPGPGTDWYETAAERAIDVYAHETAIEYSHRMLDLARTHGREEAVLDASLRLLHVYSTIGKYEEAAQYVQFVRERADGADELHLGRAARFAAGIATARGEYDRAHEEIERGLELVGPRSEVRCHLLGIAATAHRQRGDYEAAEQAATSQHDLARDLERPSLEADALQHLGMISWQQDEYEAARELLQECLATADALDDPMIEADALHTLGLIHWDRGEYDEATELYERCLSIRQELDDKHGEARAFNNLGIIASNRGNIDDAETYYERSMRIHNDLGNRHDEARCLNNLGTIHAKRTDYDRAWERFERCLEIERDLGDRRGEGTVLMNFGHIESRRGAYENALEHLTTAIEIKREIGARRGEAESLLYRAGSYRGNGDLQAAREDATAALEISRELSTPREVGGSLLELGRIEREADALDAAADHLEEAIDVLEEANTYIDVATARLAKASVRLADGDPDATREALDRAREPLEAAGATHWLGRHALLAGDLADREGDRETARTRWRTALDRFEAVGTSDDQVRALERLVEACRAAGDDEEAKRWCDRGTTVAESATAVAVAERREWFERQREAIDESS